jgi:uncharacterized protein (TIGR02118 family)
MLPMVSYFVRYRGEASDPAEFAAYYAQHHAQILRRFPEIASLTLHLPIASADPFAVKPGGSFMLAQMAFADAASLNRALRSEARREARADFARFPAFDGEVTHEAMRRQVIF